MDVSLQVAYEQTLADLRIELERAKKEFALAAEKVRSLQATVAGIEQRLETLASLPSSVAAPLDVEPKAISYADMSVLEAVRAFLTIKKQFTDCRTIADQIVAGGFRTKSPTFARNVLAMLYRDFTNNPQSAFDRDQEKRWGLKVWKSVSESVVGF